MESEVLTFQNLEQNHLFEIGQVGLCEPYCAFAMAVKLSDDRFIIIETWSSKWGVHYEYSDNVLSSNAVITDHGPACEEIWRGFLES